MKNIAIYGAGGFGRETACLIRDLNKISPEWNFVGFFDDAVPAGTELECGKIIGNFYSLNDTKEPLSIVFAIANPSAVKSLVNRLTNQKIEFPNIIAPDTHFTDKESVKLGRGNVISHRAMISCNCVFGDFNLCVYDNIFGHDLRLGSFNVFNTSTRISGNVSIGDSNVFGVNFTTLQKIKIGNENVLGASSLLTHSVPDGGTYIGVPAKKFQI